LSGSLRSCLRFCFISLASGRAGAGYAEQAAAAGIHMQPSNIAVLSLAWHLMQRRLPDTNGSGIVPEI